MEMCGVEKAFRHISASADRIKDENFGRGFDIE